MDRFVNSIVFQRGRDKTAEPGVSTFWEGGIWREYGARNRPNRKLITE